MSELRRHWSELERARADGMRLRLGAVELHHFARDCAEKVASRQGLLESRPRLLQREADRVAVNGADAFDLLVVVERLFLVERALAQLGQAEVALRFHRRPHRALVGRVGEALQRIDVVLGDELAPLALERRIVGEEDAGPHPCGPDAEVVGVRRHAVRGERLDLDWPRQVVVGVETLEDVRRQRARVQVVDLGRIEARLGDLEGIAQDLRGDRRADAVVGGPRQMRSHRARGGSCNDGSPRDRHDSALRSSECRAHGLRPSSRRRRRRRRGRRTATSPARTPAGDSRRRACASCRA